MKGKNKILSPHKIVPNLISALSAWIYNFESDDTILRKEKELILDTSKCLKELNDSMEQLRQLDKDQIEDCRKSALKVLLDNGEEDESDLYKFIEKSCGEMIAWTLADFTETVDPEGDVDENDELYSGIFENSTKLKDLIFNINKKNEARRAAIDENSGKLSG